MSEDERAIRERLAALETEVKAEATAQKARKEAALERLRAERAAKAAEQEALRPSPAGRAGRGKAERDDSRDEDGVLEDLTARASRRRRGAVDDVGNALELARRASDVKAELARPKQKGDKSWMLSAGLSTMLGPLGWLYAGSWREAAPAGAAWLALLYLADLILPTVLLLPMIFVALPLSGLAGMLYAVSYNRAGKRQRLFGEDKPGPAKALRPPDEE